MQQNRQDLYSVNQQGRMGPQDEPPIIVVHANPTTNTNYPGANIATHDNGPKPDYQGQMLVDATFISRVKFIRKVYVLLAIQLLITVGICALSVATRYPGGFGWFQIRNMWLLWLAIGLGIFLMLLIFCVRKIARTVPINYIFLTLFTIVEAYLVSALCAVAAKTGNAHWLIISASMTAGVTIGLTLYAMFTKRDFTVMYGMMFALPFILLILCLSIWVFPFGVLSSILNAIFALAYCWFLVYDTQLIMGGKRHQLDVDDYVLGVVILYIDIVGLFISILGVGARN